MFNPDTMFKQNPEKPWLLVWEDDVEDVEIAMVVPYDVPEDHRTRKPPRDPWGKHCYQLCECGHFGGDHRPKCIVSDCGCEAMKETGEWKKLKLLKITPEKGHHYIWTEWPE